MAAPGNRGPGATQHNQGQQSRTSSPTFRSEEGTLGGVAGAMKDKAQEIASAVSSTAEDAWDSTKQGAEQAASTVATAAEDSLEEFTNFLRRYPVATLCVGIGIGFLMSRLLENWEMGGQRHWQSRSSDYGTLSQS